jgi:hypothetical protein
VKSFKPSNVKNERFRESFLEVTSEKQILINTIPNQNANRIDDVHYKITLPREPKVSGSQVTNE